MKTMFAPTIDAKAVEDPRKISPYSYDSVSVKTGHRRPEDIYHGHHGGKSSSVQRHLETRRYLGPPSRSWKRIVSRCRPDLTTGTGDVGSCAAKQTERKGRQKRNCCGLALGGLIVNLDQRHPTWRSNDSFDIDNDKQTSKGKWPCCSGCQLS